MADIFLSYKKTDRQRVTSFVSALESEGFSVWWDYEIESGDNWLERIVEEIDRARCLVGFWTKNALTPAGLFAPSVKDKINYLDLEHRKAGKTRIAGAMMDAGAIPIHYLDVQIADLSDWRPGIADHVGYTKLIDQICRLATPSAVAVRMRQAEVDIERQRTNFDVARGQIRLLTETVRREQEEVAGLRLELDRVEQQRVTLAAENASLRLLPRRAAKHPDSGGRLESFFGLPPAALVAMALAAAIVLFSAGLFLGRASFPPEGVEAGSQEGAAQSSPAAVAAALDRARATMVSDPQQGQVLASAAESLAMKLPLGRNRVIAVATAHWLQSEALLRLDDPAKARPLLTQTLADIAGIKEPIKLRGDLLLSLGSLQMDDGQAATALKSYQDAYGIFDRLGEKRSMSITLNYLAGLYAAGNDNARAEEFYRRAAEVYTADPALLVMLHNNRGNVLSSMERYKEAGIEYEQALKIARQLDSPALEARVLINLARNQASTQDYDGAEKSIARGFTLTKGPETLVLRQGLLAIAARVALDRNDLTRAAQFIRQAFEGVNLDTTSAAFRDAHRTAHEIFSRIGDSKLALAHLEALQRLNDQTVKTATTTSASLMAAQFDYLDQNVKIANLRAEESRRSAEFQRTLFFSIGAATLIVIALLSFALIVIRRSRDAVRDANLALVASRHESLET